MVLDSKASILAWFGGFVLLCLLLLAGWIVRQTQRLRDSTSVGESSESERKTCPDCAESVLAAARVCRYCGYRFDDASPSIP